MKFIEIKNDSEINKFLDGLNAAFKDRSNGKLLYEKVLKEDLSDDSIYFGLYNKDDVMVAGFSLSNEIYKGKKCVHLSKVWTHPSQQGKGYAKELMNNLEKYCIENNYASVSLGVSNIYVPAISLYQKSGFKKYGVYANVPNTYYFISMRKAICYKESEISRIVGYIISKIKFFLLFKKDSTPKLLHRIIFR